MLAIQALAVMRTPFNQMIVDTFNESPFAWFREQLHQRLSQTLTSWQQRGVDGGAVGDLLSFLGQIRIT